VLDFSRTSFFLQRWTIRWTINKKSIGIFGNSGQKNESFDSLIFYNRDSTSIQVYSWMLYFFVLSDDSDAFDKVPWKHKGDLYQEVQAKERNKEKLAR
jgi:hypothetical protein